MEAGWWDAPLGLQDLAEATYIIPKETLSNNFLWLEEGLRTQTFDCGLTPLPHFFEGELINWVDKVKNLLIIVCQLPIEAGFSQSVASTAYYWSSKIRSSISPIIGFSQKLPNIKISKYGHFVLPVNESKPLQLHPATHSPHVNKIST